MGCCFCCMSEADQVKAVLEKLSVVRASQVQPGDSKFVVGRICATQNPVISPVSNAPCVYYQVICEHLVKRTSQEPDGTTRTDWHWEHLFTETKQANFLLADPPGQAVFVPADAFPMKVFLKFDSGGEEGGRGGFFKVDPSDNNPHLKALLRRHGADCDNYFGIFPEPRIRYREGTFSVNEMIAVLGTASQGQMNGIPTMILNPCQTNAYSEQYFEENGWSGTDIKSWNALTSNSSLVATDVTQYMKGVSVGPLEMQYNPGALGAIVSQPMPMPIYAAPGQVAPMPNYPQQQGYPPQQQGYPPQQQGYPPQQQGYPPQQQGYPPQQQGYPPQQQGYPPQQQGYPPQQQGYAPQQQGYQ